MVLNWFIPYAKVVQIQEISTKTEKTFKNIWMFK